MSKLFYIKEEHGEVCGYIHEKQFGLINVMSVFMLLGIIPAIAVALSGHWEVLMVTIVLVGFYVYLWKGSDRIILKKKEGGMVEIFDNDLDTGKISFFIKDMEDLKVWSDVKGVGVGIFGNRVNAVNKAQLHISFSDLKVISFGSNTYGGQLKMIKKYLIEEYNKAGGHS